MAIRMIEGVYMNTGAAMPPPSGNLPETDDGSTFDDGPDTALIDTIFRGREFSTRLPHLYTPVLKMLAQASRRPVLQIAADLALPLRDHADVTLALNELHFVGGAAETALVLDGTTPIAEL